MKKLFLLLILGSISLFAENGTYNYYFFYKDQNDKTLQLQKVFEDATQKLGSQVSAKKINALDPAQKPLIEKYQLKRAPMPFVLVEAPNGAVMGAFPSFTEEQLMQALSSNGAASCMKALQERKLALICLQNGETPDRERILQEVNAFKNDCRFSSATEVILIDPSDPSEKKFFSQLGIEPSTKEATTILISPPCEIIGKVQGAVTKEQLITAVEKANSGCCCPGGCCPGGRCK